MVLLMALRRVAPGYTVHGFRSAFRDWTSERTNFAREICEAALAHTVKDKTEAAYRRGESDSSGTGGGGVVISLVAHRYSIPSTKVIGGF
jgi:hypothetical protein